jgi:hypothetical protein
MGGVFLSLSEKDGMARERRSLSARDENYKEEIENVTTEGETFSFSGDIAST